MYYWCLLLLQQLLFRNNDVTVVSIFTMWTTRDAPRPTLPGYVLNLVLYMLLDVLCVIVGIRPIFHACIALINSAWRRLQWALYWYWFRWNVHVYKCSNILFLVWNDDFNTLLNVVIPGAWIHGNSNISDVAGVVMSHRSVCICLGVSFYYYNDFARCYCNYY